MTDGQEPSLIYAQIRFASGVDGKDYDTNVVVELFTKDGFKAAWLGSVYYEFIDGKTNGPFPLNVEAPRPKNEFPGGSVNIRIEPLGSDTWRFDYLMDLTFTDASHLTSLKHGIVLSEDGPQVSNTF